MSTPPLFFSPLLRDPKISIPVRRLTASAVANLLVSSHNQRLLLECNGVKPIVALAATAPEPELQAQCMRAIANLAVSPEYRPAILQPKALPLLVGCLRDTSLHEAAAAKVEALSHAARALANLCAGSARSAGSAGSAGSALGLITGEEEAAAIQQRAASEGAVDVLLEMLSRAHDHWRDLRKAEVSDSAIQSVRAAR